jgi:hypothetical protein
MGFRKPNLEDAYSAIRTSLVEINSPYNDGFTGFACKQELYQLKCWLEDAYDNLPNFDGEDAWEQERIVQILKRKPKNVHT